MPDVVWPLTTADLRTTKSFNSTNGFGRMLIAATPEDATGGSFRTAWFMLLLPIMPLGRYYVREGTMRIAGSARITPYEILGKSELAGSEVLRTYLYSWVVVPLLFGVPLITLLVFADPLAKTIGFGWMPVLFLVLIVVLIAALSFGTAYARKRWFGTPREVVWQDGPA